MSRKKDKAARQAASTRDMMGIGEITPHSVKTDFGELVYFLIDPTNISTLSQSSIASRIYALMVVLKGHSDIEALCLNSRESFEENKRYLQRRIKAEPVPAIRKLLEQDLAYFDRIQVLMATAREFIIMVRLRGEKDNEAPGFSRSEKAQLVAPPDRSENAAYLARVEKNLKDQGFMARKAGEQDIKRLLGVYFEQNITTERFEDFDGERWVITGE